MSLVRTFGVCEKRGFFAFQNSWQTHPPVSVHYKYCKLPTNFIHDDITQIVTHLLKIENQLASTIKGLKKKKPI